MDSHINTIPAQFLSWEHMEDITVYEETANAPTWSLATRMDEIISLMEGSAVNEL